MSKHICPPPYLRETFFELRRRDPSIHAELANAKPPLQWYRGQDGYVLRTLDIEERFSHLRVDSDGLVRRITDPVYKLQSFDPKLVAAVEEQLNAGVRPGTGGNKRWNDFGFEVCNKADLHYGLKTVQRIVKLVRARANSLRLLLLFLLFRRLR